MIIPLVQEQEWLERLANLPQWMPQGRDYLFVCPHPDDETLGAGGLLAHLCARGSNVVVAAVTDGEGAYEGEDDLRETRRKEHEQALKALGVAASSIVRLRIPDRYVGSHEDRLVEDLVALTSRSTLVIAPWPGDFHPDHEACGRAAIRAAQQTGATVLFYLFWTWHRGTLATVEHLPLRAFPLSSQWVAARARALQCHQSQLVHGDDPILPAYLLGPMQRPFEVFVQA